MDSSPQGRIFQVEYASEAVKQGSVVVGVASKTHTVLVALKVHRSLSSAFSNSLHQIANAPSYYSEMPKNSPPTRKK